MGRRFKNIQVVVVNAIRHLPRVAYCDEVTFAELVKDGESPMGAAKRRGLELYGEFNCEVTKIRVRNEKEDVDTGRCELVNEYYL